MVSGPFGRMQVIPPTVDRERLARDLVSMGDALAQMGEAWIGIDPSTRAVVVFTDRITGATFPDGDEGPAFTGDQVREAMHAMREAHRRRLAARELEAEGWLTPAQVAEAFGLPPEFAYGPPVDLDANEELIRSTRGEFAYDPWEYGDREPEGPMHWTPPPDGEDVPPWP